jgi:peptidoglycan/xylan/chitin deacetylase (PgdA/CDA1 family)
MNRAFFWGLLLAAVSATPAAADAPRPSRPALQVLNGSPQPIDIWWLNPANERVSNGQLQPGEQTVIETSLGHRFLLVGQLDGCEQEVTSVVPVQAVRFAPPDPRCIPAFYTQQRDVDGYPIVASAEVNPFALEEAAYLIGQMLKQRPDVLEAMTASGSRLCILAHNEFTTDQPEFARLAKHRAPGLPTLPATDYWDARARGMGGSERDPFCSCAEENLLGYPGDPYAAECILIHELAHNIHLRGMVNLDPTFDTRLRAAYDAAMAAGLWTGVYASVNHHEYFAEGVQSWFDNNRSNDHDHNHVDTREELIAYDRGLADLCHEVFGDTHLRYTKPKARLHGHLAGYDPSTAPTFAWPERLDAARKAIREQAAERNREANATTASPQAGSTPTPAPPIRHAIPDKLVVLTFDDSAKSHATIAAPLLKKYGFGATFFITEGFDFRENKRDYMTWDEIRGLHDAGFEIGNHTRDHLGITDATVGRLEEQLAGIAAQCEAHGIPKPVTFAWPGNATTPQAYEILAANGILFARRGGAPEHPYETGEGFAFAPGRDHPLLLPSAGDARPNWSLDNFVRAVTQARDGNIAIIQFHGVPDTAHDWVSSSQVNFEAFLRYLHTEGYRVLALRDLRDFIDPTFVPDDPQRVINERLQSVGRAP